jgi:hypothetical protein
MRGRGDEDWDGNACDRASWGHHGHGDTVMGTWSWRDHLGLSCYVEACRQCDRNDGVCKWHPGVAIYKQYCLVEEMTTTKFVMPYVGLQLLVPIIRNFMFICEHINLA